MATEKQTTFITRLVEERVLDPDARLRLETRLNGGTLDVPTASKTIDWLMKQPFKRASRFVGNGSDVRLVQSGRLPEVEKGRYAIEEDGTLKFFKVNRPTEGKWAGKTFLDIQASDDFHPIKERERKHAILALIAKDPKAAMLLYGQELGSCGHCGRTLTDEQSRERGIGPICAGRLGW